MATTPRHTPIFGQPTPQGCFRPSSKFVAVAESDEYECAVFNSPGWCTHRCLRYGKLVAVMQPNLCSCADEYPALTDMISNDECNFPCPRLELSGCGSLSGALSVWNMGLDVNGRHAVDGFDLVEAARQAWNMSKDAFSATFDFTCSYFECGSSS